MGPIIVISPEQQFFKHLDEISQVEKSRSFFEIAPTCQRKQIKNRSLTSSWIWCGVNAKPTRLSKLGKIKKIASITSHLLQIKPPIRFKKATEFQLLKIFSSTRIRMKRKFWIFWKLIFSEDWSQSKFLIRERRFRDSLIDQKVLIKK